MDLIYCAGGNKRLATIAIAEGFLYGARSDDVRTIRCDGLLDINWKSYRWDKHLLAIHKHQPKYAVVPDIESPGDVSLAIDRGWQIKECGSNPIIVPKINDVIAIIPQEFVIGVSVPSSYSGFLPLAWELTGRSIHLLGGSPGRQRDLWLEYSMYGIKLCSVDVNAHSKASDFGSFWDGEKWNDDERAEMDKYTAFKKSCIGIRQMWLRILN